MKKLQALEMIRAVAALLVVMFHATSIFAMRTDHLPFLGVFGEGNKGVDLFFVLSGFVITYVHARDWGVSRQLGNYLFNRASRIYPSVWIVTLLAIFIYGSGFGGGLKETKLEYGNIIASAFLLPQNGDALVNVTWTLKYEVFFYLLFAFSIFRKWLLSIVILWQTLILSLFLFNSDVNGFVAGFYLQPICLEFGIGMACALLVMHRSDIPILARFVFQILALATGVVVFIGGALWKTYQVSSIVPPDFLLFGVSAGFIVTSLALLEHSGRLHVFRPLVYLGEASYSIYLVHFSTITLLAVVLTKLHVVPDYNIVILSVAAAGVVAGIGFHHFIDRPINRGLRMLKRRLLTSGTAPVGV